MFVIKPMLMCFAMLLGGCSTLQTLQQKPVPIPTMAELQQNYLTQIKAEFSPSNGQSMDPFALRLGWLQAINDPHLSALVQNALANNAQINRARQGVAAAQVNVRQAKASNRPVGSLNANLGQEGVFEPLDSRGGAHTVNARVGWELDLWRKNSTGKQAANSELAVAQLQLKATELSVVGQTAKSYAALIGAQKQVDIARQHLANLQKTHDIIVAFKQEGFASMADVAKVAIDLTAAHKQHLDAEQAMLSARYRLNAWRGMYPTAAVSTAIDLPVTTLQPAFISSNLLEQRPDVAAAMYQVNSAMLRAKQARLARLPSFSLGARVGNIFPTADFSKLFSPERLLWNIAFDALVPLFGLSQADVQAELQQVNAQTAMATFAEVGLQAFVEYEQIVSHISTQSQKAPHYQQALRAANLSEGAAAAQFKEGQIDMTELLQAKRTLLQQQAEQLAFAQDQFNSYVDYYMAVGGDTYANYNPNSSNTLDNPNTDGSAISSLASAVSVTTNAPPQQTTTPPAPPKPVGAWHALQQQLKLLFD